MRTRFGSLAKDLWRDTLGDAGRVSTEVEVAAPPQRADTTFLPNPAGRALLKERGLLGRIAQAECMLEAFHDTPDPEEVRDCHRKYLTWRRTLSGAVDPALWLVVAGDPRAARKAFHLRRLRGWPDGVYAAAEGFGLRLLSVSALPVSRDTLALRLFGRGSVLKTAARELLALPEGAWELRLLPMLLRWRTEIPELPTRRTPDEEDFVSNAQQILDQWERRATDRGVDKGIGPLVRLFERRLSRTLTTDEHKALRSRHWHPGP
ncbi:MAG: hypothetical protein HY909_27315 [Deltaproteobacteria bacterium]|nr:hypothetical protein [Deltaproteobacteria bacterium]